MNIIVYILTISFPSFAHFPTIKHKMHFSRNLSYISILKLRDIRAMDLTGRRMDITQRWVKHPSFFKEKVSVFSVVYKSMVDGAILCYCHC